MSRNSASAVTPALALDASHGSFLLDVDVQLTQAVEALSAEDADYWSFQGESRIHAHSYYQYPAMMVPSMQRVLLRTILVLQPGIRSLIDPFVGSGTVLVEGMMCGLDVTGHDVNPLAILLCKAKTEYFDNRLLRKAGADLLSRYDRDKGRAYETSFANRSKWFTSMNLCELSRLHRAISDEPVQARRRFFWVALAECVRLTSNSRTSTFKLHIRPPSEVENRPSPRDVFERVLEHNLAAHQEFADCLLQGSRFEKQKYAGRISVRLRDSRVPPRSQYDLLITSPPYGDNVTTVPYGQNAYLPLQWIALNDISARLTMGILDSTHAIDARCLGGRRARGDLAKVYCELLERSESLRAVVHKLRQAPRDRASRVLSFVSDLDAAIAASAKAVRENGYLVWTLGNRKVGGIEVPLDLIIAELFATYSVRYVTCARRRIASKRMAGRNSVSDTIKTERVLILRRDAM